MAEGLHLTGRSSLFLTGGTRNNKKSLIFYKGFSGEKSPKIQHILRKKGLKSPLLEYRFLQLAIT
jgi:hypothetical protein